MKYKMFSKTGFTLVEIMIVVAIIGLLATIAIPNFMRARTTAEKTACINNLRQIDNAMTFPLRRQERFLKLADAQNIHNRRLHP